MPVNTQGQPISQGGGSIVPQTKLASAGMNPDSAVLPQVPPTLTAQFTQPPQGTMKPPAVVTSEQANDHVNNMGNAATSALNDAQGLAAYSAAADAAKASTATPESGSTDTGETDGASVDSLLSSMGLTGDTKPNDQQQTVLDQDAAAIQADQDAQQQVSDSMDAMSAGSFPLTPAEQSQVQAVKTSYQGSLTAAQLYAKNVQNGASVLVARDKLQEYSPQMALGVIRNAIIVGQSKVDQVNNRIVASMSKLTTALQNADYKTATNLYTKIGQDITSRQKEIDSINKTVTDTQKQLLDASEKASDAFTKTQLDVLKGLGADTPPEVRQAVANATDISSMFAAAGKYLQAGSGTGIVAAYSLYQAQATAMGKTPMDILAFSQLYNKAPKTPTTSTNAALNFANPSTSDTGSSTALDQAGINSWLSDFYGSGGKVALPALGIGNLAAGVKVQILNGIAQHAHDLGITGSQFAAIIASKTGAQQAVNTISRNQGMMTVAEGTATKNFDLVLSMLDKLPPKTLNPLLNQFIQTGNIQIGGADVKPLQDAILTSLNEYAKVITGQTSGAAVSDAARREAQSLLAASDTTDTIKNVINTAKTEMGNRVTSYDDAKNKMYGLIEAAHADVNLPDGTTSVTDQALNQSMTNEQAIAKLTNLAADGTQAPKIAQLRADNPTMTPVQIYQLFFAK